MYKKGQKLMCINTGSWLMLHSAEYVPGPSFQEIVTYRGMDSHPDRIGILLEEYSTGEEYPDGQERGYYIHKFQPITEPVVHTDISIFEKLLKLISGPVHH